MSNASLPEHIRATFAVLRAGAEAGRLAHGYVFSCARIDDGAALASLMLQWLQCAEGDRPCGSCRPCLQVASRTHPDIQWIEPESKSRVIKIDQVRRANQVLARKSFEGGWKACILLYADRLNDEAANAFLKTLEEPPANSLLLLITESPEQLLPTILSRCQRVHIGENRENPVMSTIEEAMLEWLRARRRGVSVTEQGGWIGGILSEVRSRAEAQEKKRAKDEHREIDKDLLAARVKAQSIEARMEILRVLYRWERDILACAIGGPGAPLFYPDEREALTRQGEGRDAAGLFDRLRRIEEASRLLERNVTEAAVWEAFLPV